MAYVKNFFAKWTFPARGVSVRVLSQPGAFVTFAQGLTVVTNDANTAVIAVTGYPNPPTGAAAIVDLSAATASLTLTEGAAAWVGQHGNWLPLKEDSEPSNNWAHVAVTVCPDHPHDHSPHPGCVVLRLQRAAVTEPVDAQETVLGVHWRHHGNFGDYTDTPPL